MTSRITLAIPNRDNCRYLSQCLDSVKSQVLRAAEVIISDNHSRDASLKVVEKYKSLFDNVLRPPRSLSYYEHLRWILEHSSGEYVIFLAGDDIAHPELIKEYDKILGRVDEKPAFVCSPFYRLDDKSRIIGGWKWTNNLEGVRPQSIRIFEKGPICNISSVAWQKDQLEKIPDLPINCRNCVDWFWYMYLSSRYPVAFVPKPLLFYRVHNNSTGNSDVAAHTLQCKEMLKWVLNNKMIPDINPLVCKNHISDFDKIITSKNRDGALLIFKNIGRRLLRLHPRVRAGQEVLDNLALVEKSR